MESLLPEEHKPEPEQISFSDALIHVDNTLQTFKKNYSHTESDDKFNILTREGASVQEIDKQISILMAHRYAGIAKCEWLLEGIKNKQDLEQKFWMTVMEPEWGKVHAYYTAQIDPHCNCNIL